MTPPDDLERRLREVAPRRVEGQSTTFAFRMDGLSLIDLNAMVNEAADEIARLRAENEALREALGGVLGCIGDLPLDRWQYNAIVAARQALQQGSRHE